MSGFKSFVDPTTIDFKTDLACIVGPNGCGKSNTIDAVRWVMGESSAKHLRGESMTDVIFNGSTGRKPVGLASVELVFDNSDGTLGGEYASFTEISIKRVVNREAQSTYYLNGVRCRRRDITHIFLGTGLGPRSYAIIEQGMISRLIEAKPDELRVYLEETAGISKYKDRRRETENRMRHTRDNMDRLNDLRDELQKQQDKLQRQAKAAEQYKEYKTNERELEAQLHATRFRDLERKSQKDQAALAQEEANVEGINAQITRLDTEIEQSRVAHDAQNDKLAQAQNHFYTVGSEVARLEQDLKHAKERRAQFTQEHTELLQDKAELSQDLEADINQSRELKARLETLEPQESSIMEAAQTSALALTEVEQQLSVWQKDWDGFNQAIHQASQQSEVKQTTIRHLEEGVIKSKERLDKLKVQLQSIQTEHLAAQKQKAQANIEAHQASLVNAKEALAAVLERISSQRQQNDDIQLSLDDAKDDAQSAKAELATLQALQQAALGQQDETLMQWLDDNGLANNRRLAQCLDVDAGFEHAVETVLGSNLQAVCVDDIHPIANLIENLHEGTIAFLETSQQTQAGHHDAQSLLSKVRCDRLDLQHLLKDVFVVDQLHEALSLRSRLAPNQSVVTKAGLWIGPTWLRMSHDVKSDDSILAREKRIAILKKDIEAHEANVQSLASKLSLGRETLEDLDMQRDDHQRLVNESHRLLSAAQADLSSIEKEAAHALAQSQRLNQEVAELQSQIQQSNETVRSERQALSVLLDQMAELEQDKQQRLRQKESIQSRFQALKQQAKESSEKAQAFRLEISNARSQLEAADKNQSRMQQQLEKLQQRDAWLTEQLSESDNPLQVLEAQLAEQVELRAAADNALQTEREAMDSIAHGLRQREHQRTEFDHKLQQDRGKLEQLRLSMQEIKVRLATIEEQMQESEYVLAEVMANLPDDADAKRTEQDLNAIRERITRLGAINLAAIEEYDATHERRAYLEEQHKDLSEALETLEAAIAKIDKETKDRFKHTFDTVNKHLSELFPQVFGGGEAYLEMTGEDLLDTGVAIMARPPGKKNSSIHLLSGGEKALTAMALVFSLFRLSPAPFCMLDEVDAPLDDTNVGRFCNLVKEMAKSVQFIFITHNKITMEMGDHMMGVTMKEPGVSRIVSVDIDEAVKMAEA